MPEVELPTTVTRTFLGSFLSSQNLISSKSTTSNSQLGTMMVGRGGGEGGLPIDLRNERRKAAIRGAFVADAASMGTHWIYDPIEMVKEVPSLDAPEFKDPPAPRYYTAEEFPGHYQSVGMLSPYGEQLLFVTEYCGTYKSVRAPGHMSEKMKAWAETFGGRQDHATKFFLQKILAGENKDGFFGADDYEGRPAAL